MRETRHIGALRSAGFIARNGTTSGNGTKQTYRHVRSNVANGVKADIIGSL
jgi:hypothetical protein